MEGPIGPGLPGPGPRAPQQPYNMNSPSSGRRRDQRSISAVDRPYPGDKYDRVAQVQRSNSSQSLNSDRCAQVYNGRAPGHMRSASAERRAHLEKDGYPGDRDSYSDIAPPYRSRESFGRQRSLDQPPLAQPPAVQPQVIKSGTVIPTVPEQRPRDISDRLASKGNDTNAPIKIEPLGEGHQKLHPKQKPQAKVEEPLQTVSKAFVIPADDPYLSKAKEMLKKKCKEQAAGLMDPYSQNEDEMYPPNGQDYRDPYSRDPKDMYKEQYPKDPRESYGTKDPYSDPYREGYSSRSRGHQSSRTKEPYGKEKENLSRSGSAGRDGYNGRDRDIYGEDPYYGKSGSRDYRGQEHNDRGQVIDGYSDKDSGYKSSSQREYRNSHKNSYRDPHPHKKDHRNSYKEQGKSSKEPRDLYDVHYNESYQESYDQYNEQYDRDSRDVYDKRSYPSRDYHKQTTSKDPYNERYPGY